VCWDVGGWEKGYSWNEVESILLFFAGARGLTKHISFFIRLIGLEGYSVLTLDYRTHMTIYFEHLEDF
jgi:hypothetical protein